MLTRNRQIPTPSDNSIKLMTKTERHQLIMKHAPLVNVVVGRMTSTLPIDASEREGLVNVGIIGLIKAFEKFDNTRNAKFATYATFRIRGAVLDELRARDWVPRLVRRKVRKLEQAFQTLRQSLGRPPTEEEAANYLKMTLEEYFKLLDNAKNIPLIRKEDLTPDYIEANSLVDVVEVVECGNPLDAFVGKELTNRLRNAIDDLPERIKLVISLYYSDEMTMKEIGTVLDLTESRVCQLHTLAILQLRSSLGDLCH